MAGFTLYETLRIFLPGLFAVMLTNVAVRLATGVGLLKPGDGEPQVIAEALGDPAVAAGIAVVVGLVLYVLNVPDRRRIYYHGDPASGQELPSKLLERWVALEGSDAQVSGTSAFFVLQDELMPDKFYQRVYLFGSLYKVIVWLRVLLTFAVHIGCFASLIHAMESADVALRPNLVAALWVLLAPGVMLIQGGTAWHHSRVRRARRSGDATNPGFKIDGDANREGENAARSEADADGPAQHRRTMMLLLSPVVPMMIALWMRPREDLGSAASVLLLAASTASALILWLALELGPPAADRKGKLAGPAGSRPDPNTVSLRERLLLRAGARPDEAPRYGPPQRTIFDAALFLPAIVAASAAAALLGRHPSSVIAWSALALAATSLGASPKHEDRLLTSFQDQRAWLTVNEAAIRAFLRGEIGTDKVKDFEPRTLHLPRSRPGPSRPDAE